jgi:hypothetical protein
MNHFENLVETPKLSKQPDVLRFEDCFARQPKKEVTDKEIIEALRDTKEFKNGSAAMALFQRGCEQHYQGKDADARATSLNKWIEDLNGQLKKQDPPMKITVADLSAEARKNIEESCRKNGIPVPPYLKLVKVQRNDKQVGEGAIIGLLPANP